MQHCIYAVNVKEAQGNGFDAVLFSNSTFGHLKGLWIVDDYLVLHNSIQRHKCLKVQDTMIPLQRVRYRQLTYVHRDAVCPSYTIVSSRWHVLNVERATSSRKFHIRYTHTTLRVSPRLTANYTLSRKMMKQILSLFMMVVLSATASFAFVPSTSTRWV